MFCFKTKSNFLYVFYGCLLIQFNYLCQKTGRNNYNTYKVFLFNCECFHRSLLILGNKIEQLNTLTMSPNRSEKYIIYNSTNYFPGLSLMPGLEHVQIRLILSESCYILTHQRYIPTLCTHIRIHTSEIE